MEKIVVLHEYGDKNHYQGLEYLCKKRGLKIDYYEFAFIRRFVRAILNRDFDLALKQIKNLFFIISLLFRKKVKIVLGVAPYDYRLVFLNPFLKKHKIYYHTSWSKWDRNFYPKKCCINNKLISFWEKFVKEKEIFCVSNTAKQSLINNLAIDKNQIDVVYHSFDNKIFFNQNLKRDIDFIYAGRVIKEKGIEELLEIFSKREEKLLIVGEGELINLVIEYSKKFPNIFYKQKVEKIKLATLFNRAKFIVLNSKKTEYWEELFGMVLIEAMGCGCIPVSVKHPGPLEIIDSKSGYLFEEGELESMLDKVSEDKRENSIKKSIEFRVENISKKWIRILG